MQFKYVILPSLPLGETKCQYDRIAKHLHPRINHFVLRSENLPAYVHLLAGKCVKAICSERNEFHSEFLSYGCSLSRWS